MSPMLLAGGSTKPKRRNVVTNSALVSESLQDDVRKTETLVQASALSDINHELEGLVRSSDVCRRVGVSRGRLSRLVSDLGILPKIQRSHRGGGIHWFSEEQITRILSRRAEIRQERVVRLQTISRISIREKEDGEAAHTAFAAFKKGLSPRDTVIEHKLSPEIVRHLWEQWQTLDGGFIFTKAELRILASFQWEMSGSIASAKDLIAVIRNHFAILREESQCRSCKKKQAVFCTTCLREKIEKVEAAYMGTAMAPTTSVKTKGL
jgi:hypothetical protein